MPEDPVRAAAASLLAIEYLVRRLTREETFDHRFDLACDARETAMHEMGVRVASLSEDEPLRPVLLALTSAYADWSANWDQRAPADALDVAFDGLLAALQSDMPVTGDGEAEASGPRPMRPRSGTSPTGVRKSE